MTNLYNTDDLEVQAIATMMGCKPNAGLVNRLNRLQRNGALQNRETIGEKLEAVLGDILDELTRLRMKSTRAA